jgi:hypothetical protein
MFDYQSLSQDELLNLAPQRDQLTAEALFELDSEISKRGIAPAEVAGYAHESRSRQKAIERRIQRSRSFYETGNKAFIGKANRWLDSRLRIEEFDTTLWFGLSCIPVFPLGSYRIRRRFRRWWNPCRSRRVHVLRTMPREWGQILLTWAKTAGVLLALVLSLLAVRAFHL